MVERGWAVAYGAYDAEERLAREELRGLWAGSFDRPRDWRVMHGEADDDLGLLDALLGWLRELFSRRVSACESGVGDHPALCT